MKITRILEDSVPTQQRGGKNEEAYAHGIDHCGNRSGNHPSDDTTSSGDVLERGLSKDPGKGVSLETPPYRPSYQERKLLNILRWGWYGDV